MTTSRVEGEAFIQINKDFYSDQIYKIIDPIEPQFCRLMRSYVRFNLLFLVLGLVEFVLLLSFFTFLAQSSVLAISLALIFLTIFSFLVLRLYFQTKKPEQFKDVLNRYLKGCKSLLHYQEGVPEHHLALAHSCCKLADSLHGKEYSLYRPPQWLDILAPTLERFSCWWHWQDVHQMKEMLLRASINEHIKSVKCEPTNLGAHANLANAYVMLSGLYADPRKIEGFDDEKWIPEERFSKTQEEKFRATAQCAIEEFKILKDYAPNDPWVYTQLAYSYHDLQMPEEEIQAYETILKLNPDDKDILFQLGVLYFQQGHNANGLRIYEQLKRARYKKTEELIGYYGAYG